MTGAYITIKQDNKWQCIEIEHLTPSELEEYLKIFEKEELIGWVDYLTTFIARLEQDIKNFHHYSGITEEGNELITGQLVDTIDGMFIATHELMAETIHGVTGKIYGEWKKVKPKTVGLIIKEHNIDRIKNNG